MGDNTFRRFTPPVHHAVALQWSPDGSTVLFKDRQPRKRPCGPLGCELNISTGGLTPVPSHGFYSGYGDHGVVYEVKAGGQRRPGRVLTYRGDVLMTDVPLEYRTRASTAGGPAGAKDVAFTQCERTGGAGDTGIVVTDPRTGRLIALLSRPRGQACRLTAETWLTDDHLVVSDWVSGHVWLWDVPRQRIRQVVIGETSGVHLEVASHVMRARFLPGLNH